MIVEAAFLVTLLVAGTALLRALGMSGWPTLPLGFLSGTALYIVIGTVQAVAGLTTSPLFTVTACAGVGLGLWSWRRNHVSVGELVSKDLLLGVALVVSLVMFFRSVHLVNWHTDSFRYLLTSFLIAGGNFDSVTVNLVDKRLLAAPLLHAPARLGGESYLRSASPIIALCVLASLFWFCREGLRSRLGVAAASTVAVVATGMLLTMNRFVFNAFYVNSHLLVAVAVLLVSGTAWLAVVRDDGDDAALLGSHLLALPLLVVSRAEGALLAALLLVPVVVHPGLSRAWRVGGPLVLAGSIFVWHGFALTVHRSEAGSVPLSVQGMLGLAAALLLAAVVLWWGWLQRWLRYAVGMTEIGLWVALIVLAVRDPQVLIDSLQATYSNVVLNEGSWGPSLVFLLVLIIYVLAMSRAGDRLLLRFPLTSFVPFVFILAYLREGAYRVGHGDSLNRMIIHVVPLMVLFVGSSVAADRWSRGSEDAPAKPATAGRS